MATILAEDFDGVTAPALPASMTFDSGWATSTNNPISLPNSLELTDAGAVRHAETVSNDGNGGNAQALLSVRMETLGINKETFVFVRRTASTTEYSAAIHGGSGDPEGFKLYKRVSGTFTQLGSTVGDATTFANNTYYRVRIKADGTSISGQCQRLTDNLWLQTNATWGAPQVDAISVTDSSISGAGTAGVFCFQDGGTIRFDNLLFESLTALASGVLSLDSVTESDVNLEWTAATGGSGSNTYKVHRSTTPGFTPTGTTPGSGTCIASQSGLTYSDTTASVGVLYFYKIVTDDGLTTVTSNQLTAQLQNAATLKLWAIGDSLFENGGAQAQDGAAGAPPILIGTALNLRLGRNAITLNSAVGGSQTSDWQPGDTNMDDAEADAISAFGGYSGLFVLVNLGANDAAASNLVSAATYNTNLGNIVTHLLGLGVEKVFIVQQTYIPPGANGGATTEASVTLSVAYRPFQVALANGTTVFTIGGWAYPFMADNILTGSHTFYQDDLTHLLRVGNQAWASGLANEIYLNLFPSTSSGTVGFAF